MVLKNIGITGGTGLVGTHLAPFLAKKNFNIIVTSKSNKKNKSNINYKKLDLSKKIEECALNKIFKNIDCLIHLGAVLPNNKSVKISYLKTVNLDNVKKLIDWANKKNILFIFFSTISIFSSKNINYIKYKKKIEKYLLKKKIKYLIIRPSSIYGAGQKDKTFLIKNIIKINKKKKLTFYKPFKEKLNFIHAHDVSRAILFLIRKKKTGIFNLTNDKNLSIPEIIKVLKTIFKIPEDKILIEYKKFEKINKKKINSKKINKLGWNCKIKLQNGIIKSFLNKKIIV